jgi:hypothetical protein
LVQSESPGLPASEQLPAEPLNAEEARLRDAERAFEAGDYRELARRLNALRAPGSAVIAGREQELARVVTPDWLQLAVLAACSLVLLVTFFHYVLQ